MIGCSVPCGPTLASAGGIIGHAKAALVTAFGFTTLGSRGHSTAAMDPAGWDWKTMWKTLNAAKAKQEQWLIGGVIE